MPLMLSFTWKSTARNVRQVLAFLYNSYIAHSTEHTNIYFTIERTQTAVLIIKFESIDREVPQEIHWLRELSAHWISSRCFYTEVAPYCFSITGQLMVNWWALPNSRGSDCCRENDSWKFFVLPKEQLTSVTPVIGALTWLLRWRHLLASTNQVLNKSGGYKMRVFVLAISVRKCSWFWFCVWYCLN